MGNLDASLKEILSLQGSVVVALVDYGSGMMLGSQGDAKALNLEVAAAGNTEVVRAKMRTMDGLGLNEAIEDILITLDTQYHLIRLVKNKPGLFIYLVLLKDQSNLAMARYKLADLEQQLEI
ncbi:MAG: hypothetical protein ACRCYQ_13330 [Nocardioides sp.]